MAASSIWERILDSDSTLEKVHYVRAITGLLTHTLVAFIHLIPKAADKRPWNRGVVGSWYWWCRCWVWAWVGCRVGIRVGPSIHWVGSRDAQIPAILVDTHHVPTTSLRDGPAFINICRGHRKDRFQWSLHDTEAEQADGNSQHFTWLSAIWCSPTSTKLTRSDLRCRTVALWALLSQMAPTHRNLHYCWLHIFL